MYYTYNRKNHYHPGALGVDAGLMAVVPLARVRNVGTFYGYLHRHLSNTAQNYSDVLAKPYEPIGGVAAIFRVERESEWHVLVETEQDMFCKSFDRVASLTVQRDTDYRLPTQKKIRTLTLQPGWYAVGDPCYLLSERDYDLMLNRHSAADWPEYQTIEEIDLVTSSTGYGDGCYDLYVHTHQETGEVTGLRVNFIEDEDEDDYDY